MSDFNTPEGDKNKKLFTPLIQNNMLITGASNIEILKGIKNGNTNYYTNIISHLFGIENIFI